MVSSQISPCFLKKYNSTTTVHKIYGQDQLRFKRNLTIVGIFGMPQARLPAFHFEIGVSFFQILLLCRFKMETDELVLQFLTHFFPVFPFIPSQDLRKSFQGLLKGNFGKEINEKGYQKENKKFSIWFPSKKLR